MGIWQQSATTTLGFYFMGPSFQFTNVSPTANFTAGIPMYRAAMAPCYQPRVSNFAGARSVKRPWNGAVFNAVGREHRWFGCPLISPRIPPALPKQAVPRAAVW